jgi:hypothetical protein
MLSLRARRPAEAAKDAKEATPLIAGFSFARDVPARETRVPPILARKQCKTVT